MPFGKYKGIEICDIDIGYLKWLSLNINLYPLELKAEIEHEIEKQEGDRPGKGFVRPK